ncbi:MAG: hypothetical protein MZV70_01975 [Desulfobacterales bacterium]|nr:hypothetical protein [Desulfobacterales bacterium]
MSSFYGELSASQLSVKLSKKLFAYTAIADDVESIGNHITLITDLVIQKAMKKIKFSESGEAEIAEIIGLISRNLDDARAIIS